MFRAREKEITGRTSGGRMRELREEEKMEETVRDGGGEEEWSGRGVVCCRCVISDVRMEVVE